MPDQIYQLLLVDDSQAEARLFQEVLRSWAVRHLLTAVQSGQEALDYLERSGDHAEAVRPDLIFLDLSMPAMDGFETLRAIRRHDDIEIASIPVIVLTNSSAPSDVKRAYQSGANCYITKPENLDACFELMAAVEWFWFEVNKFPPPVAPPAENPRENGVAGGK
jgi:two-component system, chemotaxis family, response regulator Rcp1